MPVSALTVLRYDSRLIYFLVSCHWRQLNLSYFGSVRFGLLGVIMVAVDLVWYHS